MPPAIQSCRLVPLRWLNRPNRPRIHCGHARLYDAPELGGVVAKRLDGEARAGVTRRAGNGERVPVPAVDTLQIEHGELSRREGGRTSERRQRDLGDPGADVVDLGDLVVVQRTKYLASSSRYEGRTPGRCRRWRRSSSASN